MIGGVFLVGRIARFVSLFLGLNLVCSDFVFWIVGIFFIFFFSFDVVAG